MRFYLMQYVESYDKMFYELCFSCDWFYFHWKCLCAMDIKWNNKWKKKEREKKKQKVLVSSRVCQFLCLSCVAIKSNQMKERRRQKQMWKHCMTRISRVILKNLSQFSDCYDPWSCSYWYTLIVFICCRTIELSSKSFFVFFFSLMGV